MLKLRELDVLLLDELLLLVHQRGLLGNFFVQGGLTVLQLIKLLFELGKIAPSVCQFQLGFGQLSLLLNEALLVVLQCLLQLRLLLA